MTDAALKFSTLDADSREFLENDEEAHRGYLDLLTYVHERVLAALKGRSVTPLDRNHVDYGLGEVKFLFRQSLQIGRAARHNIGAADALAHLLGKSSPSSATAKNHKDNVKAAGKFLEAVLKEYDSIRVIPCKERVS